MLKFVLKDTTTDNTMNKPQLFCNRSAHHAWWFAIRRLSFGIFLMVLLSGILLYADRKTGKSKVKRVFNIAVMQHSSQATLDEGVQGMIDGLAESGFKDRENIAIRRYCAEGDMATANAIARDITNGRFDLIMTASTLSLQVVASANREGKTPHVFAVASDPAGAGVGISRDDPLSHPKHIAGFGSMQPVKELFRLAAKLYPGLKAVGVVWNPSEQNSEVNVRLARDVCKELGISLLEANVDTTSAVFEAASSLVARGAHALWIGADTTVITGADTVISAAKRGNIPVFTSIPPLTRKGALFDLGANYHEVGRLAGVLAGQILHGKDPATVPVTNIIPEKCIINMQALHGLKDPWQLPEDVLRRADEVIDEKGNTIKEVAVPLKQPQGRGFKIGIVYFAPDPGADSCMQGIFDGLRDLGLEEGKNLEICKTHAQGEIINIPALLQNYDGQELDLIITMSTPCLTAACSVVKKKPVVFTFVYDPIAAGAGKTGADHLPHVTGVGSFPPVRDTVDLIQRLVPGVRTVGTLYNSSEANSGKVVSVARDIFQQRGIKLEEIAITGTNEVFQAAQTLAHRNIQAFWITGDNTAMQAFDGIAKVANDGKLPIINNDPEFVERGALACAGLGFYQAGYAAAKLARRVLQGEIPRYLPFAEVAVKTTSLNFAVARKLGVIFSPELIHECDVFVDLASQYGRPARIAFIEAHNDAGGCRLFQGLLAGLGDAGLLKEKDYTAKPYTLNLVTGRLSEIIPDIRDFNPELVIAENEETVNEVKKIIKEKHLLNIADISKANKPFTSDNFETGRRAAIQIARILAVGTD